MRQTWTGMARSVSTVSSDVMAWKRFPLYWTFVRLRRIQECKINTGISYIYARIFYRGVPGFAIDCPCGVWCRGLTTCLLYVAPLFGNLAWNDCRFVSLTYWRTTFSLFSIMFYIYLNASQYDSTLFSFTLFTFQIVLYFFYIVV